MTSDTLEILTEAVEWRRAGRRCALATVISTWGSSPRPVGSKLVVDEHGHMIGSVSGGCVEGAVVENALETIRTGAPKRLEFGVSDEQAWEVGLACGGRIAIFVETLSARTVMIEQLLAVIRGGACAALATNLVTGARCLVTTDHCVGEFTLVADELLHVRQMVDAEQSRTTTLGGHESFVDVTGPRQRLIVVGGVHTAQSLVPMAHMVGYQVTVVDPRSAFAAPDRFPNTHLVNQWPDQALPALNPDRRTAIVTLTHNPNIDDAALAAGLRSQAFYLGALGSRRTHAKRCERLSEAGFDAEAIRRIRGPIGLHIGAVTPGEIAIAILAEITASLRRSPLAQRAPEPLPAR
jgi:xanthine dehydrogenase accessory factor